MCTLTFDGTERVLRLNEEVMRYVINPQSEDFSKRTKLLFAPRFTHYDFNICYSSTRTRVGQPVLVRIFMTDPSDGNKPVKKHGCRLVVAATSKSGGVRVEQLVSQVPDLDGAFVGVVHFETSGVYYCNVQADYFNVQSKDCKISVGMIALLHK